MATAGARTGIVAPLLDRGVASMKPSIRALGALLVLPLAFAQAGCSPARLATPQEKARAQACMRWCSWSGGDGMKKAQPRRAFGFGPGRLS